MAPWLIVAEHLKGEKHHNVGPSSDVNVAKNNTKIL
jgi:hypothetical protein